ncbi:hypothetical protein [Streptomyces sp. NPDC006355]|uniref:hypothetical protein n=1 Tax=Streptomyces sp. NPDC006355 TaxID=3156758 RepID=UPI0033AF2448
MSVEVRVNPGALDRLLRRRGGPAERRLRAKTRRVADIAAAQAPGSMGDYVDWRVEEGRRGLQGVITCDHPAVFYVLDGTPPHIIRARRAKYLRFEVGGQVLFRKMVRHPGTDPNDFMGRALRLGR